MPVFAREIALGSRVPWFEITTLEGETVTPDSAEDRPMLVMFLCSHSPYVQHIQDGLGKMMTEYQDRGLYVVAVSPNDPVSYPSDNEEALLKQATDSKFTFPYALDGDQKVARAFEATCTPEFYLYSDMSRGGRLAYHGRYDGTRPGHEATPDGRSLRAAIEAVVNQKTFREDQKMSFGCSVKWKSGQDATVALVMG